VAGVAVPEDLTEDERGVWGQLAPHAIARQTLTPATAYGFGLLCRLVVLERLVGRDPETAGKSDHRGLVQRIDAELLRFDLAPNGRPHASAPSAKDKPISALAALRAARPGIQVVQ
jgi:hypothetical protein